METVCQVLIECLNHLTVLIQCNCHWWVISNRNWVKQWKMQSNKEVRRQRNSYQKGQRYWLGFLYFWILNILVRPISLKEMQMQRSKYPNCKQGHRSCWYYERQGLCICIFHIWNICTLFLLSEISLTKDEVSRQEEYKTSRINLPLTQGTYSASSKCTKSSPCLPYIDKG